MKSFLEETKKIVDGLLEQKTSNDYESKAQEVELLLKLKLKIFDKGIVNKIDTRVKDLDKEIEKILD